MIGAALFEPPGVAGKRRDEGRRLADAMSPLLGRSSLPPGPHRDEARLLYILSHVPVGGRHFADVGGNTGVLSFELLGWGARRVDYHEGHPTHHAFMRIAAEQLGLADRLHTCPRYASLAAAQRPTVDCAFLLNTQPAGGSDGASRLQAVPDGLAAIARTSRTLVFQPGAPGPQSALIRAVEHATAADWTVTAIGIAERVGGRIRYRDGAARDIPRDGSPGDPPDRPLFILASRHTVPAVI